MLRRHAQNAMKRERFSTLGDKWAPERLGKYMRNPLHGYTGRLEYQQKERDTRKNTFNLEFFRSKQCRSLLKVSFEGSASIKAEDGQHVSMAARYIRKGEIVERGILRAIDEASLDDFIPNPYVLRLGHDFLLGLPWSQYSDRPGPPFLASGTLPSFKRAVENYNVELTVKESHVAGFECDAVAIDDIPLGSPLIRRVAPTSQLEFPSLPRYADLCNMTDIDVQQFLDYQGAVDEKKGRDLPEGAQPQVLHKDAIFDHVKMTATSGIPILNCTRSVCLPHPVWDGYGVFATEDINAGEIVESGMMHQLQGLDGNKCPYVFTWNKDGMRKDELNKNQWCTGGGNSMFYNSDFPANTRMYRFHDHFRYLIIATQDICEGEELMHLYVSSSWRKCFVDDLSLPKLS